MTPKVMMANVVVVVGASGYLAHRLVPLACERATVIALSRTRPDPETLAAANWVATDACDADQVGQAIADAKPTAVINAAAVNPGQAPTYEVNMIGAHNVATAAQRAGARLVHVSSDVVFSGNDAPYDDDATPDPVNDYGRSKAEGERLVAAACPSAAIVRTSLIYGLERIDRGTAGFIDRLEQTGELNLWSDAIRQPVWIDALSRGLLDLALDHLEVSATLNLVGDEAMSRAAFGRAMLQWWGIDTANVAEGPMAEASAPRDLRVVQTKAAALGLARPGVNQVLAAHR